MLLTFLKIWIVVAIILQICDHCNKAPPTKAPLWVKITSFFIVTIASSALIQAIYAILNLVYETYFKG